jgi:hypothetical protein
MEGQVMDWAPWARIMLRYGIGYLAGSDIGERLALDPDAVFMLSMGLGAAVEGVYSFAKRKGWAT